MWVGSIAALVITGTNAFQDVKKREIFLIPTLIAFALGIVYSMINQVPVINLVLSTATGFVILAASIAFNGQIGAGDAIVMLALGSWNDARDVLAIFFTALFFAAAAGCVYWVKKRRNTDLPFVLFLLAGSAIRLLYCIAGG